MNKLTLNSNTVYWNFSMWSVAITQKQTSTNEQGQQHEDFQPPDETWLFTVRCESDLKMIGLVSARSGKLLLQEFFFIIIWWHRKTRILIKYKSEWNSFDSLFCSLKRWYNVFLFFSRSSKYFNQEAAENVCRDNQASPFNLAFSSSG